MNQNKLEFATVVLKKGYKLLSDKPVRGTEDAVGLMSEAFRDMPKEYFCTVNVNTKGIPINANIVSVGELSSAIVHPRNVFQSAILSNAAGIILFHNHPSGDPTPSFEDEQTTQRLIKAGEIIGIPVLDHIIIAGDVHKSILYDKDSRKKISKEGIADNAIYEEELE